MNEVDRLRKRIGYRRLFVGLVVGIWASLVVRAPRDDSRSAGECGLALRGMYAREKKLFATESRYTTLMSEVEPTARHYAGLLLVADPNGPRCFKERGQPQCSEYATMYANSWSAVTAPFAAVPARVEGGVKVGLTGTCPACQITLACLENNDGDSDLSVWSISTVERLVDGRRAIAPGEPWLEHDDADPLTRAAPYPEYLQ